MTKANNFFDFDFAKIAGDFKFPTLATEKFLKTQQRNFEALSYANQVAAECVQAILKRQAEMLRSNAEEASRAFKNMMKSDNADDRMHQHAEMTKNSIERSLASLRELTQMVAHSNREALDTLQRRVSESLDEIQDMVANTNTPSVRAQNKPRKSAK
ncbi:MAG: phasin family protein [Dongiaceae bacterium]